MEETFKQIPLDKIKPSPTNPRNAADYKKEDLLSLALSIKESGLIQPVRVRPNPEDPNHTYELIVGERRYRAHLMKEAEKTTIDAIICDYDDTQVIVAQNIENIQRKDVHAMDEAKSLRSLLDLIDPKTKANKYTTSSLAAEIGKSKSYIWQTIILVQLIEPFQNLFREGKINKEIAMMLARQTEAQQKELKDWVEGEVDMRYAIDPEDLKGHIEYQFHLELKSAPFDKDDATLVPEAGSCTMCGKSTANAPDLFNDLGKSALCTDSACFKLKKVATFERNMKALRKSGETFVIVNPDRPGSKNVLSSHEYTKAKKTDKGAVQAIHSDDKKRGAIEWVKPKRIPMNIDESKGTKKKSVEKVDRSAEKERKAEELVKKAELRYRAIVKELVPKIPKELTKDIIKQIAIDHLSSSDDIFEAMNINFGIKNRWIDDKKQFKIYSENGVTPEQMIYIGQLGYDMGVHSDGNISPEFLKVCDKLGVDYKAIIKKIDQEDAAAKEKEKSELKKIAEHSKTAGTIGGVGSKKKK